MRPSDGPDAWINYWEILQQNCSDSHSNSDKISVMKFLFKIIKKHQRKFL